MLAAIEARTHARLAPLRFAIWQITLCNSVRASLRGYVTLPPLIDLGATQLGGAAFARARECPEELSGRGKGD